MMANEKADPTSDQDASQIPEPASHHTSSQARSDPAPDVTAFTNRLRKNRAHWRKWVRRRGLTCFRIYGRDVPQCPFAIEWFETISPRTETNLNVQ